MITPVVQKGILCPPLFLFHLNTPQNRQSCDTAVDERPGHCGLQRAGSESRCLISMCSPSSPSPPSHLSAQDDGCANIANIKCATRTTRSAFAVHFPPTSNVYQGTGDTLSKITNLPTVPLRVPLKVWIPLWGMFTFSCGNL
ncbi:hypothetical protein E3U43_011503 [Larimichthys crocea]|uniref:Uncharacterized protein n=1 Tax=Larimichthys crocea TaxID=215358 RepID=A0ACD3QJQ4_LARCR|nr:hypothetical protein E3U43_011503 [Larimichthys crocea]